MGIGEMLTGEGDVPRVVEMCFAEDKDSVLGMSNDQQYKPAVGERMYFCDSVQHFLKYLIRHSLTKINTCHLGTESRRKWRDLYVPISIFRCVSHVENYLENVRSGLGDIRREVQLYLKIDAEVPAAS
jgi:hypothetical protein